MHNATYSCAIYTGVFMRIIQSDKYANQGDDIFLSLYMYAKKKKKKKKKKNTA